MTRFNAFDPLQQAPIIDCEKMNDVLVRPAVLERGQKFVQQIIGGSSFPGCRAIKVHAHDQAIVHSRFENTRCGGVIAQAETLGEMLEQGGLAVPCITAQDDEADSSLPDVAVQRLLQVRFHIGPSGEVRV